MWGCAGPAAAGTGLHSGPTSALMTFAVFVGALQPYCRHCLGLGPFVEVESGWQAAGSCINDGHG